MTFNQRLFLGTTVKRMNINHAYILVVDSVTLFRKRLYNTCIYICVCVCVCVRACVRVCVCRIWAPTQKDYLHVIWKIRGTDM